MTGSISFNREFSANLIVIGAGAGGGTYYTYNSGSTTYNWSGCGGGGGGVITTPFNITGSTIYNLFVGQGGKGGINQQGGTSSLFGANINKFTAGGATVTNKNSSQIGFVNSSGCEVSITNVLTGFIGWGGGGGGGEGASNRTYGTGGTGGSYQQTINPGGTGTTAVYYSISGGGAGFYGGTGGNAYQPNISIPFSSLITMPGGGGGGGGSGKIDGVTVSYGYLSGYAGRGFGGQCSRGNDSTGYGAITNACNNSYSQYNVLGTNTAPGPTG